MLNFSNTQKINMINILVTGGKGQLGCSINEISNRYSLFNIIFTDISNLDISDFDSVNLFVLKNNINVIVNCAAYTAVDLAETNISKANEINHLSVINLAKIAKENNVKLIHISTDYVFDGNSSVPYKETDITNPQSVYGKTKLEGELGLCHINPHNSIIIRTSWLYSRYGNNFVKTILKISENQNQINVVSDQFGTPTNASDLASTILEIIPKINNKKVEIFHFSNKGVCSWYDFAKSIFSLSAKEIELCPASSDQFLTKAKRPLYSVLDKSKIINEFSLSIKNWDDSLSNFFKNK